MNDEMYVSNPFTTEISLLYPEEYQIGLKGKDIIKNKVNVDISDDEVGYITLHIHSAITSEHVTDSIKTMEVIQNSINDLEKSLKITININSISYLRLMNHMNALLMRIRTKEKLQMDINGFTKDKFPFAYTKANDICEKLSHTLGKEIPESEVGYLALHLERILSSQIK